MRVFVDLRDGTADEPEYARAYFVALGRFVHLFSRAEIAIQMALHHYAGTPFPVGQAVFSGTRIVGASQFLGRLATAGRIPETEWQALEPLLKQLAIINGRRNLILHYGADADPEGRLTVTNAFSALREDAAETFPITPDTLDDMTHDVRRIIILLHAHHMGGVTLARHWHALPEVERATWRYTPPPQAPRRRAEQNPRKSHLPGSARQRQRPPQSSSE